MLDAYALEFETIDEVKETIEKHLAYVQSLKRLQNTRFVAISRLLPEIFALIFEQIAFSKENEGTSGYTLAHPCLHVAQVCSSWREMALGLQSIWGLVYTDSSKPWLEEIKRRSGSCPLFFRRPCDGGGISEASLSLLRQQKYRVKVVDLRLDSRSPALDFVFKASFPILESLKISGRKGGFLCKYTGNAECLRFLSLKNYSIDIVQPCWPALQTLRISYVRRTSTSMDLLSTLKHLPNLRYVQLKLKEATVSFKDTTVKATDPTVVLPRLEHLHANNVGLDFLCVLGRISAPRIKAMVLVFVDHLEDNSMLNPDAMFNLLPSSSTTHWQVRPSIVFASCINPSADIIFSISIYPSRDVGDVPIVEAMIKFGVNAGEGCYAAANLFSLLPAGHLECVHIDCLIEESAALFKPLVDALANVQEVHFGLLSSAHLLLGSTSQTDETSKASDTLSDVPLPNLQRILVIMDVHPLQQYVPCPIKKGWSPLRKILGSRLKRHPIQVLKLGDSIILRDNEMKSLQALVEVEMLDHEESMAHLHNSESLTAMKAAYWSEISEFA